MTKNNVAKLKLNKVITYPDLIGVFTGELTDQEYDNLTKNSDWHILPSPYEDDNWEAFWLYIEDIEWLNYLKPYISEEDFKVIEKNVLDYYK